MMGKAENGEELVDIPQMDGRGEKGMAGYARNEASAMTAGQM